jgi:hypothetical protein
MKTYLGDGAYAEWDGHDMTLTTSNGIEDTNTVVLEPGVLGMFLRFVQSIKTEDDVERAKWSGETGSADK